jgi:predicted Zn-dependent protease with MMP-like domain
MTQAERERFDALVEEAIETLPPRFREALEEVPVVVVDRPSRELVRQLRREGVLPPADGAGARPGNEPGTDDGEISDDELLGLHTGVALTERSVNDSGTLPGTIHIFREGVVLLAGGWGGWKDGVPAEEQAPEALEAEDEVFEEIRVTLLHELGHHFGLDEDDLERLGYA